MKKTLFFLLTSFCLNGYAAIIPLGSNNNSLYYKIGGSKDFTLPPVSDTSVIRFGSNANLGIGNSCSAFNPALSITNSINNIKDSVDNLEQNIIGNATGSLIQFPMYLLAQANPTIYNLLNNKLLSAHKELEVSTKSCELVKDQISQGKNPYQDWGTIAVGNQWKQHLGFVSSGSEDINHSKKEIDAHAGDDGVPWVQGKGSSDSSLNAGGKAQPPIYVIADTTKAGYNAILNRDLQSDSNAPKQESNEELIQYFPNPKSASDWLTNVVGDQVITTCNDDSCKKKQGSLVAHGLLPWVTSCQIDKDNCEETIRNNLTDLTVGKTAITQDSLSKISTEGMVISPDILSAIQNMDDVQKKLIISKLSQEIAVQRIVDKSFIAKRILIAGSQVPVIASNAPAQKIIDHALKNLDEDIRSLLFESEMRKKIISNTLSETLKYSTQLQSEVLNVSPVTPSDPLLNHGAKPSN